MYQDSYTTLKISQVRISIMADRGFTTKDMLDSIGVKLNIPIFMEGRKQLPASEVSEGRKIASVKIHIE